MRSINNRIIKFIKIIIRINIKIDEISVNSAIFIIKNNQIFKYFIFETPFIIARQVNFKNLNNSLIIIYMYNMQSKNCIMVKTIYTPSSI